MNVSRPFAHLTAANLMSPDVIVISEETPLREAACLLAREHISGAPVVDAEGRCVGILSANDFVRWASESGLTDARAGTERLSFCAEWEMVDVDRLPTDEVRAYMTRDPVTAERETPIAELARRMLEAHIHRMIVVDKARRPVGIVTSTDLLAAVAYTPQFGPWGALLAAHRY